MDDAQDAASEAGRQLARARWQATAVNRALATVVSRADQLNDAQLDLLANLRALRADQATAPPGGDADGDG